MQNKYIDLTISCILFILNSCAVSNLTYNSIQDDYLISLTTPDGYYADVIIPINMNEIVVVNATVLLNIYDKHYQSKFLSIQSFLKSLYSYDINDIVHYLDGYGLEKIDLDIIKSYNNNGLDFIVKKYLKKYESENYHFTNTINYTVCAIMYSNNFYLYYDDQMPTYIFSKELKRLALFYTD